MSKLTHIGGKIAAYISLYTVTLIYVYTLDEMECNFSEDTSSLTMKSVQAGLVATDMT